MWLKIEPIYNEYLLLLVFAVLVGFQEVLEEGIAVRGICSCNAGHFLVDIPG